MSTFQKLGVMLVGGGILVALVLPGRQTPAVAAAVFDGFSRVLGTAMATRPGV